MHPLLRGVLRVMEKSILYDPRRDEIYELDDDSMEFLSYCTGRHSFEDLLRYTGADRGEALELLDYLLGEGILRDNHIPEAPNRYYVPKQPIPSLRYLQIHVTERCNLNCRHCYLGRKGGLDLPISLAKKAVKEFADMGMKLLITGGEPLLYPAFWELLSYARRFPVRIEVLSNGTLITSKVAERLGGYVDCLQISLDGLKEGHDFIRGRGAFQKTVRGIKNALPHLEVSVATMIHSGNLEEFPGLESLIRSLGVKEWNLDLPSLKGNMIRNREIEAAPEEAAEIYKSYGFGGETHEGYADYSCGTHLCSITVRGDVTKCGFFTKGVGNLKALSMSEAWHRVKGNYLPLLKELKCSDCRYLRECRGGCRYRAMASKDFYGKDPFMCLLYGAT
jgi:radical SAM protein with 4Fe4S-binding SPASM domain